MHTNPSTDSIRKMHFSRQKHVKYWRMNATLLPNHYLSNDSSRMTLGYFIVAALDLLDALKTVDLEQRSAWVEWIYSCQCPEGGFRGFSGTNLNEHRTQSNRTWDPANIPATFFALATLLILGDDMERVHRAECLSWLPKLQRSDGSFGEVLGDQDAIGGGRDLRYCCCAAGIAFMLQGANTQTKSINWEALTTYVQSCQNYNGGFGEAPLKEPHSGLTYCAIATLTFAQKAINNPAKETKYQVTDTREALRWILERQTDILEEKEETDDGSDNDENAQYRKEGSDTSAHKTVIDYSAAPPTIAGFNGRDGKIADTCYCFWNSGTLALLGHEDLIDREAMQRYLLEKVQHMIGGFGKGIGAPPDVMHSYLGLAALSATGFEGLKPVDPSMCISQEAASRLPKLSWKRL